MMSILRLKTNAQNADMNGDLTVISLFSGCGGSSLGYKWAGFKELLAVDFDKHAVETFKLNFSGIECWQKDIRQVTAEEILKTCNIKEGELTILDGSPPCQGFSMSGKREIKDIRNLLPWEFIRFIKELKPHAFIMENVSGMIKDKMRGIFKELMLALKETGYYVECRMLNAMYYGVPQSRERLIWIGMRDREEVLWPERQEIITLREALDGVPSGLKYEWKANTKSAMIAKMLKPDQAAGNILGWGHWFSHRKLCWEKPASTITTQVHNFYHPDRSEPFTIPELLRIFSYPDDFKGCGSWRDQAMRLGNSVPPKMIKAIALSVRMQLRKEAK